MVLRDVAGAVREQLVGGGRLHEGLAVAGGGDGVEDVERALAHRALHHAALFQQVALDPRRAEPAGGGRQAQLDPLPEAGGVVVPHGLGIAQRLEHGARLHTKYRVESIQYQGESCSASTGLACIQSPE